MNGRFLYKKINTNVNINRNIRYEYFLIILIIVSNIIMKKKKYPEFCLFLNLLSYRSVDLEISSQ